MRHRKMVREKVAVLEVHVVSALLGKLHKVALRPLHACRHLPLQRTNVAELREPRLPFQVLGDSRTAGRSKEVLKIRVLAVLLRELDKVTLRCWHEREAAVRDVPGNSSVTSRLAGARKGRESFPANKVHNVPPRVVMHDNGNALLGIFGGLRDHGVDQRLKRGVRPLRRHGRRESREGGREWSVLY